MTLEIDDPQLSAEEAGLRYVNDAMPGIGRRRAGKAFSYIGADGDRIDDQVRIAWFKGLAIPPAWTDVWISPIKHGHIQATGRDARGRKQYRYHPRWREVRDEAKYGRLIEFARTLPKIRRRTDRDLRRRGYPRDKVLALVVRYWRRPSSAWATRSTPATTVASASQRFEAATSRATDPGSNSASRESRGRSTSCR